MANANAGSKIYVSPTPFGGDAVSLYQLVQIDDWVEIRAIGSHGEAGSTTNVLTYDTWDTDVIQKAKGMTDAGSPEIEVARIADDPGQEVLRAASLTNRNYAFRMVRNDGTILYNVGLVAGPRRPFGRNEDFDLEIFTLAFNQREIFHNDNPFLVVQDATVSTFIREGVQYHQALWRQSGFFGVSAAANIYRLAVVGGGGSGGSIGQSPGGGGAGELIVEENFAAADGSYLVYIGAGGPATVTGMGNKGSDTTVFYDGGSLVAEGGGAGASTSTGGDGGCGGGGGSNGSSNAGGAGSGGGGGGVANSAANGVGAATHGGTAGSRTVRTDHARNGGGSGAGGGSVGSGRGGDGLVVLVVRADEVNIGVV